MRRISGLTTVGFALMLCLAPAVLRAAIVTEVNPEGTLALEDGKKVSLAGIQMDEQGVSILRVLTQNQNIRLEVLETVRDKTGGECAYVYLRAKSIKMPFKIGETAGEEEVLLNEFLIELGAAKVDVTQEFAKKNRFLNAQEKAKERGEGVWSYVVS